MSSQGRRKINESKRSRFQWSSRVMQHAISDIQQGKLSEKKAAAHYGAPKTTLLRHLKNKNKFENGSIKQIGRCTDLGRELVIM